MTSNVVTFEPTLRKFIVQNLFKSRKVRQKCVYCIRILVNDLVSEKKE